MISLRRFRWNRRLKSRRQWWVWLSNSGHKKCLKMSWRMDKILIWRKLRNWLLCINPFWMRFFNKTYSFMIFSMKKGKVLFLKDLTLTSVNWRKLLTRLILKLLKSIRRRRFKTIFKPMFSRIKFIEMEI